MIAVRFFLKTVPSWSSSSFSGQPTRTKNSKKDNWQEQIQQARDREGGAMSLSTAAQRIEELIVSLAQQLATAEEGETLSVQLGLGSFNKTIKLSPANASLDAFILFARLLSIAALVLELKACKNDLLTLYFLNQSTLLILLHFRRQKYLSSRCLLLPQAPI